MYLKTIEIENVGPIDQLNLEFPHVDEHPLPVILVGENGSGKSILLSYLVNSLIVGKGSVFENTEVEKGKVYKYRSPRYIKSGKDYSFASVDFESGVRVLEWQLKKEKNDFEKDLGYVPARKEWAEIPGQENSFFNTTFSANKADTSELFKKQCCLYFPVNRFEEPAWLNLENLTSRATYTELKHLVGHSNRNIICTSPLKENKNWLLDLLLDRHLYETQIQNLNLPTPSGTQPLPIPVFAGYSGQSATMYEAVIKLLRIVLRTGEDVRLGVGTRKNRQVVVMRNEEEWVPNLFQLSTGETLLLNLFLTILRDFDFSDSHFTSLNDVKGIVVIDEVDAHLHTAHQREVLPQLIASFPNVQFIITTHSPLFLLGMEEKFGVDGFRIHNMPNAERVVPSDFSEFTAAYDAFKETTQHRREIQQALEQHSKPIVFVEGEFDIKYLTKAAELLGKSNLLDKIQMKNGDGFGNLNKIWNSFDNPISAIIPSKLILLYDCDIKKQDAVKGQVYRRVVPYLAANPIITGIENLFSAETIEKVEQENPQFIDIHAESTGRIRNVPVTTPASKHVNKDEKGNMCDWLCENGEITDFQGFESVFQIIDDILNCVN